MTEQQKTKSTTTAKASATERQAAPDTGSTPAEPGDVSMVTPTTTGDETPETSEVEALRQEVQALREGVAEVITEFLTESATADAAAETKYVGDTIDLGKSTGMVRLPDGSVVTCRGTYTARHPGRHVFTTTTETTVIVADAALKAV